MSSVCARALHRPSRSVIEELKDGSEQSIVAVTVQSLYRSWDIPARRLDKLRPSFSEPTLFARMKPLNGQTSDRIRPAFRLASSFRTRTC